MSIPNVAIYDADGSGLQSLVGFGSRPLGGTSNPAEVQLWNDKSTAVSSEAVGTGDGTTAVFSLANADLIPGSPCTVTVAGSAKTEGTHYSLDKPTGTITFVAGNIPTAGQAIAASYHYGTGAGTADNVYLLVRRRAAFTASGASVTLPSTPSRVYEVHINGAETEDYSVADKVVTFDPAPTPGDALLVIYEDESCTLHMLQGKSSGVVDPFTVNISDDAQSTYLGIGGSGEMVDESLGVGDDATILFNTLFPCVIANTLTVEVDGSAVTNWTLDPLTGEIEFDAPPADELPVSASYRYYSTRQIGAIPPGCARKLQLRGHAPTATTLALGQASLEVWAV